MSQRISRRTTLIGAAAAAAVLVVVLIVVLLLNQDDSTPASGAPTPAATTPSYNPTATPTPAKTPGSPKPTSAGPSSNGPTTKPTPGPTSTTRPKKQTVAIDATAPLGGGTTAEVTDIKPVDGKAELPGEVGGPAISVTFKVTAGTKAIDFDQTVVNAYYGADNTPAVALTTGTTALTGVLPAGDSASGTYVFRMPKSQLNRVSIELDFALTSPVTVFRGAVS